MQIETMKHKVGEETAAAIRVTAETENERLYLGMALGKTEGEAVNSACIPVRNLFATAGAHEIVEGAQEAAS